MAEPIFLLIPGAPALRAGRGASLFAHACNCFVEGTEVSTPDGLKPIEQVSVGDLVLARDEETGETAYKPVVALIAGDVREIWEVTIETIDAQGRAVSEPIGTTEDHPWRTIDGRWVETKDLTPGTELVSSDGGRAVVASVLKTDRSELTYNFEVEGFHTYFVGESQVWVHNACLSNVFTQSGRLTQSAISGAREIIPAGLLRNNAIPSGFSKWSTRSFSTPSGRAQVHFYMNRLGDVLYDIDYKTKFNRGL